MVTMVVWLQLLCASRYCCVATTGCVKAPVCTRMEWSSSIAMNTFFNAATAAVALNRHAPVPSHLFKSSSTNTKLGVRSRDLQHKNFSVSLGTAVSCVLSEFKDSCMHAIALSTFFELHSWCGQAHFPLLSLKDAGTAHE